MLADGTRTPIRYITIFDVCDGSADQLAAAQARIERGMEPPARNQSEAWLAELSVITARRQDDDSTEALRLTAYASRLADYPADVARAALLEHRWRFFPSWAELAEVCDALVAPRRQMAAAIEKAKREAEAQAAIPAPGDHHETAEERRVSADRARAIMADVMASMHAGLDAEKADEGARRAAGRTYDTQRRETPPAAEDVA